MAIWCAWFSFKPAMKFWLLIFIVGAFSNVYAQQKTIEGIVFDKYTKERIAKVNIVNQTSNASVYNNLKAEFKITAAPGNLLIFSKNGYFNDTVKLGNDQTLAIYLKRTSIQLRPVTIRDNPLNPQIRLESTKRDYNKAYGSLANHDLLSSNSNGAGLSIDALYNLLSKEGRNAAKLREVIESDYRENVIDYRFSHSLVANITSLKEPQLTDFMQKYRPGYYFVTTANDYDFINYIRNNFRRYKRNPNAFSLQPLNTPY
jgi:hypothetical protein